MRLDVSDSVDTLMGDPRKAMLAMAGPIALSYLLTTVNNLVDGVWLSGLGTAALAATAVMFPYYFLMMALGNGIGTGAAQSVARRIGAGDLDGARACAAQAVGIIMLAGSLWAIFFTIFTEPLMMLSSAGTYVEESVQYALPIFMSAPALMLGMVFSALLRAEGAAGRSMIMTALGTVTNLILDPIFIYVFGWGVTGASVATVFSMTVTTLVGIYWYFGNKSTFIRIPLRHFRFDRELDWDVLRVGAPAVMDLGLVTLTSLIMNRIMILVDPEMALVAYNTGWRILNIILIPANAMGCAMIPICAAAYGSGRNNDVDACYGYCLRMGLAVMSLLSVFTFIFAPYLVGLFTYSEGSAELAAPMTEFIRISCMFLPFSAMWFCSTGLFQALGKGTRAFACTLMKHSSRILIALAVVSIGSMTVMWSVLTISELIGSVFAGIWAGAMVTLLMRTGNLGPGQVRGRTAGH